MRNIGKLSPLDIFFISLGIYLFLNVVAVLCTKKFEVAIEEMLQCTFSSFQLFNGLISSNSVLNKQKGTAYVLKTNNFYLFIYQVFKLVYANLLITKCVSYFIQKYYRYQVIYHIKKSFNLKRFARFEIVELHQGYPKCGPRVDS